MQIGLDDPIGRLPARLLGGHRHPLLTEARERTFHVPITRLQGLHAVAEAGTAQLTNLSDGGDIESSCQSLSYLLA